MGLKIEFDGLTLTLVLRQLQYLLRQKMQFLEIVNLGVQSRHEWVPYLLHMND